MRGVRQGLAVRAVVAALLAVPPVAARAAADDAFPPLVHAVADVTADHVPDVVLGQPVYASPLDQDLRIVDGRTGRIVWRDVVPAVKRVAPLAGGGIVVASTFRSDVADVNARSLRLRMIGPEGDPRWERTFTAHDIVPNLFPSYILSRFAGVLDAPPRVLVQTDTRVDGGANRVTRTMATTLDAATGATVAEHGPIDTATRVPALAPLPGRDAFVVVAAPVQPNTVGDGSIRAFDATSGAPLWSAQVRTQGGAEVRAVGGAVALTSPYYDGLGVQLLAPDTGSVLVDRARGDQPIVAGGKGAARRVRAAYVTSPGERVGYGVDLLDPAGRLARHAFFPVGTGTSFGVEFVNLYDAGDVDADGWIDLVAHVSVSGGGSPAAADDRLVLGRTLGSSPVARAAYPLALTGAGTAAMDGHGDDLYVLRSRAATVIDGATRRPLLGVRSSSWRIGALVGVDAGVCDRVVVLTFSRDDVGVTLADGNGRLVWSTGDPVTFRPQRHACGATRAARPAAPRIPSGPLIPASGGIPMWAAAVVAATAVAAARARRASGESAAGA